MGRQRGRLTRRQALRLGVAAATLGALAGRAGPGRAAQLKTPGVYVIEKSAFANSVVQVATAVPAFVGHTERARNGDTSLRDRPWRITSPGEFRRFFGGPPAARFDLEALAGDAAGKPAVTSGGTGYGLAPRDGQYLLYDSLRLFFANGGGPCYVVSVGDYGEALSAESLRAGIDTLEKEAEPTLLVVPDAMRLAEAEARSVQQAMLRHCGETLRNRFAILDLWGGFRDRSDPAGDPVAAFRKGLGAGAPLGFAAAYYPWLETTVVGRDEVSFESLGDGDLLRSLLKADLGLPDETPVLAEDDAPEPRKKKRKTIQLLELVAATAGPWAAMPSREEIGRKATLSRSLESASPFYKDLMAALRARRNRLPPAAAMAGIYTTVDNARGVWKAPANVSLASVAAPSVAISNEEQEDLNVTTDGKSVNAIRGFNGEGVLVWGARTLDGNSLDWRYINVRRTMIMLEESIRLATRAYVFEPNDANTWVTIRAMIENFLTGVWKQGGLAGSAPRDAFSVHLGLNDTMTPVDVLEGNLRVTVLVALNRPAEFIEFSFVQRLQKP